MRKTEHRTEENQGREKLKNVKPKSENIFKQKSISMWKCVYLFAKGKKNHCNEHTTKKRNKGEKSYMRCVYMRNKQKA